MKLTPFAVFLLLVMAPRPAAADPEYPKVGYEIEIGRFYAVRYDGAEFTDIYEKTAGSYLARTRGIVPDNNSREWPLLQITVDNVKRPANLKITLHDTLQGALPKPVSRPESYRGIVEIVTGPLLHRKALQKDVAAAARLFVTTLYDFCSRSKQPAFNYYAVSALVDAYNGKLKAASYETTIDKGLLELTVVNSDTAYLSCPGPEHAGNILDTNLSIDVQATFGVPLTLLADGDSGATWRSPRSADLQAVRTAVGTQPLSDTQKAEFVGLVRIWYPLMHCALNSNAEGEQQPRLVVLCDKNFARPMPRADVCALTDRFWSGVPAESAATIRSALEPSLLTIAKQLADAGTETSRGKLGLPPLSKEKKTGEDLRNEDAAWNNIAGVVLQGTEVCKDLLKETGGSYLAYADGTIIPPLDLRLTATDSALGLGLEIRMSDELSDSFLNAEAFLPMVDKLLKSYLGQDPGTVFAEPPAALQPFAGGT
ncbi:MAG: hypothetical protein AAGE85_01090 [Pseudomonadota bacterium]